MAALLRRRTRDERFTMESQTDRGPLVNRKQAVTLVVRIMASVAMLAFLLTRLPSVSVEALLPSWSVTSTLWLGVAAALTLVGIVLSALRWQKVLDALDVHTPLRKLLSHYLAGQFVSNVLPTTIGGDVLRVSRLSRETGESPNTFASVVLERLTGWLVLPIITFVGFVVNPRLTDLGTATTVALGLATATLVGLILLLVAVADRRIGGRFDSNQGWRRFAGAVHLGLNRLRAHPAAAFNVIAVGFAYQLVLVLAALSAARALGIGPGRADGAPRLLPGGGHRPGPAHRHLGPGGPGGRLRAVPHPARRGRRRRHRARPPALPAEPGRQPARRPGVRGGRRPGPGSGRDARRHHLT
jgi:glycosyltransferase 2 family protein